MSEYHKMYRHLFNEVTKAISILQDAQIKAEEMYMGSDETPIELATENDTPSK